ncbi:MAG: DUF2652 domain-containing protein [Desulfobacterales bacterium]|nr:MAG: DUF2652 domain-containing protein [Desulfobacterales bacterium]
MDTQIQKGYVVLADISGFTSFMEETEIAHSSNILRNIIELIIGNFTPTMIVAEVEGDAVFAYAADAKVSRGELLLEIIEATYAAFRDRQRTMAHNATCPCKACSSIAKLDLKFVTHYGDYILQDVAGKTKPVGSSVNAVHRLLKNSVGKKTGWHGYALFSEKSLEKMGVQPAEVHTSLESYEHLGEINTSSINLDERYRQLIEGRRVFLASEAADTSVAYEFSFSPAAVWDWLGDPHKRTRWMKGSAWEAVERPNGRTGPAAQNHCTNGDIVEQILDWRPFDYYTVKLSKGLLNLMITGELEPTTEGTHLKWNIKMEGGLPRWVRRRLCRHLVAHKWRLTECFNLMAQMMEEAGRN